MRMTCDWPSENMLSSFATGDGSFLWENWECRFCLRIALVMMHEHGQLFNQATASCCRPIIHSKSQNYSIFNVKGRFSAENDVNVSEVGSSLSTRNLQWTRLKHPKSRQCISYKFSVSCNSSKSRQTWQTCFQANRRTDRLNDGLNCSTVRREIHPHEIHRTADEAGYWRVTDLMQMSEDNMNVDVLWRRQMPSTVQTSNIHSEWVNIDIMEIICRPACLWCDLH